MAITVTPRQAAAWLRKCGKRLRENVAGAERMSLVELRGACRRRSQGALRARDLRRMDHPYARRHGGPLLNPDVVNSSESGFGGAWELDGPTQADGALSGSVWNSDPKANYLSQEDGDSRTAMFARHPHEAAAAEVAPRREERLEQAIQDSFQR
jgi:hypothetical protein